MVLAGVLCVLAGALVLWGERAGLTSNRTDGENTDVSHAVRSPGLSTATRYLIGIVLLVWGYHLGVWAFSSSPTVAGAIQFPQSKWWLVLLVGAAVCILSAGVDRLERRGADRGPPDAH